MTSYVCPICLFNEPESPDDYFVSAACGHIFHSSCIMNVIDRNFRKCPLSCATEICRASLRRVYGISTDSNLVTTVRQVNKQGTDQRQTKRRNFVFKIVLLGDSSVGKTSIISRFYSGTFDGKTAASIGCDICIKTMVVGNANVEIVLWDTAGQEIYRSISAAFLRDVHGIIFAYDITNKQSYENVPYWMKFARENGPENCVRVMIGNKCDITSNRQVEIKMAKEFAKSRNIPFFETSAKDDVNCQATFRTVAAAILQNQVVLSSAIRKPKSKKLSGSSQRKSSSGCC